MRGDDAGKTKTLGFDVYVEHDGPFAVLRNPGPETPVGTLAEVQAEVDARADDFEDGAAYEPAGVVRYVPGKDDGHVVDVDFDGGAGE